MVRFSDLLGGGAGRDRDEQAAAEKVASNEAPGHGANDPYAELAALSGDAQPETDAQSEANETHEPETPTESETSSPDAKPAPTPEEILARLSAYAESMRDRATAPQRTPDAHLPSDSQLPPPPPPAVDLTRISGDDLLPSTGDGRRKST